MTTSRAIESLRFRMVTHITSSLAHAVLFLKSSGTGTADGARTNFTGTVAVIGGRRRFEAVRGDGTLTGVRYTPLSEGADLVSEYTLNLRRVGAIDPGASPKPADENTEDCGHI
jgi:hypothetical protein